MPVTGNHTFQSLDAGAYHGCRVTTGGDAYCWGYNYFGQVGDGSLTRTSPWAKPSPTLVMGSQRFRSVSAGTLHTCGATISGEAYRWGDNGFGQLGDGTFSWRSAPVFTLDLNPAIP